MNDSILDEIKEKVRAAKERVANDPALSIDDKRFIEGLEELFDNVDAVDIAPKLLIYGALFAVGYKYDELKTVYNTLINEIRQVYKLVDPEYLTINIVEKKKPR